MRHKFQFNRPILTAYKIWNLEMELSVNPNTYVYLGDVRRGLSIHFIGIDIPNFIFHAVHSVYTDISLLVYVG